MSPHQIANIMKLAICVATLALLDNGKGHHAGRVHNLFESAPKPAPPLTIRAEAGTLSSRSSWPASPVLGRRRARVATRLGEDKGEADDPEVR